MVIYRKVLGNFDNKEEYRTILSMMFEGEIPRHPVTEYLYYKEFGPDEKLKSAEKKLEFLSDVLDGIEMSLSELNISPGVKEIVVPFYFPNMPEAYVVAKRK